MLLFKMGLHSYRELPIRMAETTILHRNELSGVLGGLTVFAHFRRMIRIFCASVAGPAGGSIPFWNGYGKVYEAFNLPIAEAVPIHSP